MSPRMGFPMSCIHTVLGVVGSVVPPVSGRLTSLTGCGSTVKALPVCILSMTEPLKPAKLRLSWVAYNRLPQYSD